MQAPASLMPEARKSFTHAVATIEAMGDDASLYRDAIERLASVIREPATAGQPAIQRLPCKGAGLPVRSFAAKRPLFQPVPARLPVRKRGTSEGMTRPRTVPQRSQRPCDVAFDL